MKNFVLVDAVNEVESEGFKFVGADNNKVSKSSWNGRELLNLARDLGNHRCGDGMKAAVEVVRENPNCEVVGIYINTEFYFVRERKDENGNSL